MFEEKKKLLKEKLKKTRWKAACLCAWGAFSSALFPLPFSIFLGHCHWKLEAGGGQRTEDIKKAIPKQVCYLAFAPFTQRGSCIYNVALWHGATINTPQHPCTTPKCAMIWLIEACPGSQQPAGSRRAAGGALLMVQLVSCNSICANWLPLSGLFFEAQESVASSLSRPDLSNAKCQ